MGQSQTDQVLEEGYQSLNGGLWRKAVVRTQTACCEETTNESPPAHQPASPKIGFLQLERGTNHDRIYLRGRLALRDISNGGAPFKIKIANSYIIEIAR